MTNSEITLSAGQRIGNFDVINLVSAGGSGLIYQGLDSRSGRLVAIKVARRLDPAHEQRLKREASALSVLTVPGAVRLIDTATIDGRFILVTDWVEGRTLADLMASDSTVPVTEALSIGAQLADGLDQIHQAGYVHRDLSPSNVILDERGRATIVDFGAARPAGAVADGESPSVVTEEQTLVATAGYVAPEVVRGEPVSGSADQYSLSVLLYQMVAGRLPFPPATTTATAVYQHLTLAPTPLIEARPNVSPSLDRALARGMAKDPADRFPTVRAMIEAASTMDAAPTTRRPRRPQRPGTTKQLTRSGIGAVAIACVVLLAGLAASITWAVSATGRDGGEDGQAAALACNRLTNPDFNDGMTALDFFREPAGNERVIAGRGVDGSAALEVGRAGVFGQYSEVIEVGVGERYRFSGWFSSDDGVVDAKLGITFVDANFQAIADVEHPIDVTGLAPVTVESAAAPAGTAFALPWLFKDASNGSLYADELVFAPTPGCADGLQRSNE